MIGKKLVLGIAFFSLFIISSCKNDDGPADPEIDRTANLLATGDSANDLLSDTTYNSLVLEIVSVRGFELRSSSVQNLTNFLNERINKPGGIRVIQRSIDAPQNEDYSLQQIANIERDQRQNYNSEDEIAVYLFNANRKSEEDTDPDSFTLGAAYRNTSFVLFGSVIQDLGTRNNGVSTEQIESATLQHEFAHLLGLVDLGTPMQTDHLDEENGQHCNVANCLMNFQITFSSGNMNMMGSSDPELDPLCIADLQANGGR
ncbi:membrane metalloprotease [Spongiivirga citrea]|uniref:Membrane metalloprotease n=1 Tax=Spongiivirga citrea TaxID=1481457 RepID=A0A6M0CJH5_9FLAO|nr:membrane metalloprotease [Spongiivirga citrea]NER16134.1 membrane metalloprotease [Spongiivirga citrea]